MPPEQKTISPSHFSPDTLEFIRLLCKHEVKFVVVGGEAVIFHGHVRFTGGVDFFYSDEEKNICALFEALNEFWDGSIPGINAAQEFREPGIIFQFGRPPNRIDLLNRIDGVTFNEAWRDRLILEIVSRGEKISLSMLNLDQLLINKRAAGRPKDLEDLKYLEQAKKQSKPGLKSQ